MHRCKTCFHWAKHSHRCLDIEANGYLNMRDHKDKANIDVRIADDHNLEVYLQTGEDFGCLNWSGE